MTAAAKKTTQKAPRAVRSVDVPPGHPDFDWRSIYPDGVALTKYTDPEKGTVICLPPFPQPDQGAIFADLLEDVPDQIMMLRLVRQAVTDHASDPQRGVTVTAEALRCGVTDIADLLSVWTGVELPKF